MKNSLPGFLTFAGFILGGVFLTSALGLNSARGQEAGLALAKKAALENRKTVESIRSLSCKSDIVVVDAMGKAHPDQKEIKSGKYWSSGDSVHFAAANPNNSRWECLESDGVRTTLSTKKGPTGEFTYSGTISKVTNFICFGADLDRRCLLRFENRKPPVSAGVSPFRKNLLLDEVFDEGFREFKECQPLPDGTILLVFHVVNRYKHEFTVDPRHSHLVTKYSVTPYNLSRETPLSVIAEVKEFQEVMPALFIPSRIAETLHFNGKLEKVETTTLSQIAVNQTDIAMNLKIDFPPTTTVLDSLRNKRRKVRADGSMEDIGELSRSKNTK